ncbi:hypothetical protein RN001_005074 [Aquatica leii]|uniref:Tudor domain-containing protein 5 n=1 Tax=Aquatica leii TaxID=1421715 RepID=A0AAN7P646_9COLE|nr:hypothetical protein RN001_005074 [Aquatica leii]
MSKELDELKKIITGILVSSPLRLTIANIDRDYADLVGERIPFRKFGFTSLEGCLHSMRDILQVMGTGVHAEVMLRVSDKSSHINQLVTKQKVTKPKGKQRFGSRPPRARRTAGVYQNNVHPFYSPKPLMSFSFQPPPNFFFSNNNNVTNIRPTLVANPKEKDRRPSNENKAFSPVTCTKPVQEYKEMVKSEPVSSTSNGTIPKQISASKLKEKIDSDSSDSDAIYFSDSDDEYDSSFVNTTENIHYITQEHICDLEPETEINVATPSIPDYSDDVPPSVQNNLMELIAQYDDGIWCGALPEIYKKMFKKDLDYAEYGYRSLISMCMDLQGIFHCIRPDTGDFKLYDKKRELPKDYNKSIKISQMFRYFKDRSDKPSSEPAVINIENEAHSTFRYPENVVELYDEIPRQFLPDSVKEDDYIDVCIGEVYDPSKFWILLDDYTNQLNELMDEMQSFYTGIDGDYRIPEYMITVGLYCVAQYNKEYHRAMIVNTIKAIRNKKVKVYYIDYGTVSAVDASTLKFLHKKFCHLPQQAIRARLASIYPPTEKTQWSCEASSRFLQLVLMKTLVAQIHRIDTEKQIIEIFLVDTSGKDDIYMNDKLVEEGYAVFTDQEQEKVALQPHETPWVKYIHFFPTFLEIEYSAVPSATEMIQLLKSGIPLEHIYPRYFIQENTRDELVCDDIKDVESINQDQSVQKEVDIVSEHNSTDPTIFFDYSNDDEVETQSNVDEPICNSIEDTPEVTCSKPPPGITMPQINATAQLPQQTEFPNCTSTSYISIEHVMNHFAFLQHQRQQQMLFQNIQNPYLASYNVNSYTTESNSIYQNQREVIQYMMYQFLIENAYLQSNLTNYLVQQGQWQYTLAPNQMYAYLSLILNTVTPVSNAQRSYIIKEILKQLTNQQIVELTQRLGVLTQRSYKKQESININSLTNSFHKMTLNQSANVTSTTDTTSSNQENVKNDYNTRIDTLEHKQRYVTETDLNNKKIHLIWYNKEPFVNVEEIAQLTSNKIPIENIRKQIVMMDPTISIVDLPLRNYGHIYEEISRFKKNVDKQTVLHIVPVTSMQKVLIYLGSTLDVSAFLAQVAANTELWFNS